MDPGGIEGVGEAVSGGLLARAVEPGAGETAEVPGEEAVCLNCGTPLIGPHCHNCGQAARIHRSVAAWWHDLAHGVLHLDGKIWRTLPMLAWRPGELTRRYIQGERARFVSPLALFLFSVFLMFAVLSAFGGAGHWDTSRAERGFAAEVRAADAKVAALERERGAALAAHRPAAAVESRLKEARAEASLLRAMRSRGMIQGSVVRLSDDVPAWLRGPMEEAGKNPSLLIYKLQTNAYKFSWALIPISVPFLWLLLLHRRRHRQEYRAFDHLVFVTYSIAFMSLAFITLVLIGAIGLGGAWAGLAALIVPPLHIYRQLRGAYHLGRFSAIWRTAALLVFAGVAMSLFLLLLLALGVLA